MPSSAEPSDPCFIRVRDLHKRIGEQHILGGVTLDIQRGSGVAIIGGSGTGKSVFLKLVMGLIPSTSGSIKVDGTEITTLSERKLAPHRRKIGLLFQDGALFDSLDVEENVGFPLVVAGWRDRSKLRDKVRETLESVDLGEHLHKLPSDLSGGMRKRAALARAIITEPQCVLYDEPTSGLDPVVADSIDHLIRRTQRRHGITSIVVTHDMKSVRVIADQVVYLREGVVYFSGTPDELMSSQDPVIRQFVEGNSGETS
ncbi:MAG: ATP-binding cassette domain-containing protein [Verrucomicrobiaceae bacterium]|nr:MAG: ATP-binding cassette domain-containing protein [Verrucomicrobiaceae bacterium]